MKTQKLRLYFHAKHASYILSSIRIFRYPYSALFLAVLLFSRYIVHMRLRYEISFHMSLYDECILFSFTYIKFRSFASCERLISVISP